MDEIASISAHRHCGRVVVTASVNNVSFDRPIFSGEIVTLEAKVSRSFSSSMEVFVDVHVEKSNGHIERFKVYNDYKLKLRAYQNRSVHSFPHIKHYFLSFVKIRTRK